MTPLKGMWEDVVPNLADGSFSGKTVQLFIYMILWALVPHAVEVEMLAIIQGSTFL